MVWLAALFFVTAALYASVGFGGGSTYSALLVLADVDYRILPAIALVCNIIVVTAAMIRFARAGELPWARVLPLVLISAPFAWLGGRIAITEESFVALLGGTLFVAGALMLLQRERPAGDVDLRAGRKLRYSGPIVGGGIGLLSGMVGIGGGIFLAPILHLTRWAPPRQIAATASFFILVNSIAGLAGQLMKIGDLGVTGQLTGYWPLALAVLIGGQIGSSLSLRWLSPTWLRRLTAMLILYVSARLILHYFAMA